MTDSSRYNKGLMPSAQSSLVSHISSGDKTAFMERIRALGLSENPCPEQPLEQHAKETAKILHEAIQPAPDKPKDQGYMPICPMPTDLCRVSPFFPMSRRELKIDKVTGNFVDREHIKSEIITKSAWGEIEYTGYKLSTYEEDALIALIAILDQLKTKDSYTYTGPIMPILKMMGYDKPNKDEYIRVKASFELMAGAVFKVIIKGVAKATSNILSHCQYTEKTKKISISLNPYFYEQFMAGSVTLINVLQRRLIVKPVAKSLHKFMQSQRGGIWEGHFLTLAATLNLNLKAQMKELRRLIEEAMSELKKIGFIQKKSVIKKDIVKLYRVDRPRPTKIDVERQKLENNSNKV